MTVEKSPVKIQSPATRLQFRPGISLAVGAGRATRLHWSRLANGPLHLEGVGPGATRALQHLANGGATRRDLLALVQQQEGYASLSGWRTLLNTLERAALIQKTIYQADAPLLTLVPDATPFAWPRVSVTPQQAWRLSPFSYLRRVDDDLVLASPEATAQGLIRDPRVVMLWQQLAAPQSLAQLAAAGLTPESVIALLAAFQQLGAVEEAMPDNGRPAAAWEFHALLFHTQTRAGRSLAPVGATYHQKERFPCPPVVKTMSYVRRRPLFRPSPTDEPAAGERSLLSVMERRRSLYDYGDTPLTAQQLGEFLYRTARIQQLLPAPDQSARTGATLTLSQRPYPGGGALYPLEIYLAVRQCAGLKPALYHYCPRDHLLGEISTAPADVAELLAQASPGAEGARPQVLVVTAARFQRLAWKYERIAYALLLKECGALMQNMYLVATDMGLAGCALGLGDSDLFSRLIGSDYYAETSVGEFALGSRATGQG